MEQPLPTTRRCDPPPAAHALRDAIAPVALQYLPPQALTAQQLVERRIGALDTAQGLALPLQPVIRKCDTAQCEICARRRRA